jgi:hypothetical protein
VFRKLFNTDVWVSEYDAQGGNPESSGDAYERAAMLLGSFALSLLVLRLGCYMRHRDGLRE